MLSRKFTRREFLGFNIKLLGFWLTFPIIKLFKRNSIENISHKEASFYKKLAG